ncbi:MAG: glycosyltransferase [Oceanospirillaceae bacterium]|nr:glycosyltransferase [Oceanospirillaceae bacterium]
MSADANASDLPQKTARPVTLVIGYVWPEPNSSAAGSRMMQLIQTFQQRGYRVVFASPAEESSHAVALETLGIEAQTIELNSSSFDDWIAVLQPALVMFDRFMMEEQFGWRVEKSCPDAIRILDMEDVHSLRDARWKAVKQNRVAGLELPTLGNELAHSELAIREVASIWRCDLTLVISEAEMDWLQTHYQLPASLLSYTPFMERHCASSNVPGFEERQHFVFIGNFRHAPNWDAVRLLKEIWPQIRKQQPESELHIYGGYPPKKATDLHDPKQGFLVKGWAEDAQEVVRNARVMLAPLRFGAGLKGKLIDAARNGTPAVTTPVGSEGMYAIEETPPALTSCSVAEFIDNAVRIYTDPAEWRILSDAGQRLIPERFDADTHQQALMNRVEEIREQLEAHRQSHFYGLMLRHHSLKSTQYMSQWIEAKNRAIP